MPAKNPQIQTLIKQLVGVDLIDSINDPTKQAELNGLCEADQIELAQDIVVGWIDNGLEARQLLRVKDNLPATDHDGRLTGFNLYFFNAVNLFALMNGVCDGNNPRPEEMVKSLDSEKLDQLDEMDTLKSKLMEKLLLPNVDSIVARLGRLQGSDEARAERQNLTRLFRREPMMMEALGQACELAGWIDTLKSESPWDMFEVRGFNSDLFLSHVELVEAMITPEDARSIGEALKAMPVACHADVTEKLHTLDEAFRGLNRVHASDNIFSQMNASLCGSDNHGVPGLEELKRAASDLQTNSLFRSAQSSPDNSSSDLTMSFGGN